MFKESWVFWGSTPTDLIVFLDIASIFLIFQSFSS